jgi:ABC-type branched-subunit amino acid transport system ATPase component
MIETRDISVRFGGVRAVSDVSIQVGDDEVVGVIGPNGSGKSTFLNSLTGLVPATGELRIDGTVVPLGRPRDIRARGLLRVFQSSQAYAELTCLENVLLSSGDRSMVGFGGAWLRRGRMRAADVARREVARDALAYVGLDAASGTLAGALTYGQQRLLDLARAVAGAPRLLMLDEPSAGLNESETEELAWLLDGLRAQRIALLIVDHKIDFIDALCDRIAVLELGSVIAEGTPETVWNDQRVIDAYLGVAGA